MTWAHHDVRDVLAALPEFGQVDDFVAHVEVAAATEHFCEWFGYELHVHETANGLAVLSGAPLRPDVYLPRGEEA